MQLFLFFQSAPLQKEQNFTVVSLPEIKSFPGWYVDKFGENPGMPGPLSERDRLTAGTIVPVKGPNWKNVHIFARIQEGKLQLNH